MNYGDFSVAVEKPSKFRIKSSGPFTVFGCKSGERIRILGPDDASRRVVTIHTGDCDELQVVTDKDTAVEWTLREVPSLREKVDPIPVAIPADAERPESLESMMARMISAQFLKMKVDQGHETFEEANDFDIDDELDPISPYELQDMPEEVVPAEGLPKPTDKTAAPDVPRETLKASEPTSLPADTPVSEERSPPESVSVAAH